MQTSIRQYEAKGFTLIELLVTIGIIGVLASLVFFAAAKMRVSAGESQCRSILGGLSGVAAMYEASTKTSIEHLDKGTTFDQTFAPYWQRTNLPFNNGNTGNDEITGGLSPEETDIFTSDPEKSRHENANLYSERFVWIALQIPGVRERFIGLGENTFVDLDDDGFMEIRDPWGSSIAYAVNTEHYSRVTNDQYDDFLPNHPDPFFASAGSDMKWGAAYTQGDPPSGGWSSYQGSTNYADSRDNLYSFDLDRTSAEVSQ